MDVKELIRGQYDEEDVGDVLLMDGFDEAYLGLVSFGGGSKRLACYSEDKIIKVLMDGGMSNDDAWEYYEYNIKHTYMGEYTPVILEAGVDYSP
jgi:hypothetical protein